VFLRRPPLAHPLSPPAHFVFAKAFGCRRIVYQFDPAKRKEFMKSLQYNLVKRKTFETIENVLQVKEAQISAATAFRPK
jgi:hypothetical protein